MLCMVFSGAARGQSSEREQPLTTCSCSCSLTVYLTMPAPQTFCLLSFSPGLTPTISTQRSLSHIRSPKNTPLRKSSLTPVIRFTGALFFFPPLSTIPSVATLLFPGLHHSDLIPKPLNDERNLFYNPQRQEFRILARNPSI